MSEKKSKKPDNLDTETTFANMNVEGMPWYNPSRKDGRKKEGIRLTRAEKWAMFKAGFAAIVPFVLGFAGIFLLLFAIMALWIK